MKTRFAFALLLAASFVSGHAAEAGPVTISNAAVGGGPQLGATYDNLNWVDTNNLGAQLNPTLDFTVTLFPDAKAVLGSLSGQYAAPYIYNSNGVLFGDNTAEGPDTTKYLTTGSTDAQSGAKIQLDFVAQQTYFGMLWGSVDTYNTLTFYLNGVQVGQFTGSNINPSATGDQGYLGTYYVNFVGDYDQLVAVSSTKAFEFDNVAFGVPDGGATLVLLGCALMGMGVLRRKLRR